MEARAPPGHGAPDQERRGRSGPAVACHRSRGCLSAKCLRRWTTFSPELGCLHPPPRASVMRRKKTLMDQLLNPSFMKNPPVKLDIPAKTLGMVYAILGAIGTLFGVIGLLGLSVVAAAVGAGPLFFIGTLIGVVGTALAAWG